MPIILSRKGGAGTGGTATGTAQALSIGVSTGGNTSGNTTVNTGSRFVIVGSNGITASQGTAAGATTVTLSGITQTVQTQGVLSVGVSTGGNTAGNTTVNTGSRFVLVASGDATASQATAAGATTVTLSVGTQQNLSAGVSTGGNTSGDTTVNTGSRFVLAGGDNITLSQATAAGATTVTISAGTAGGAGAAVSQWPPLPQNTVSLSVGAFSFASAATRTTMTALILPMAVNQLLSVNYIRIPVNVSLTSATSNSHWGFTVGHSLGIYSLTDVSLSLVSSFSNLQNLSYSSAANSTNASATWQMSYGSGAALSTTQSLSTNNAGATNFWSSISSMKNHPLATGAMSLGAGQYFAAWVFSSSTSGANLGSLSGVGAYSGPNLGYVQDIGRSIASSSVVWPLAGVASMTQTNTAMPVSFATADVTTATNNSSFFVRQPALLLVSQF